MLMPITLDKLKTVSTLITLCCFVNMISHCETPNMRGAQFIPFDSLSSFKLSPASRSDETVLTSPIIQSRISWDELIVSWNAGMPADAALQVEVSAVYPGHSTKFYSLGLWSADLSKHPRESVPGQKDADGDVLTDTLVLKNPAEQFQIRVTLQGDKSSKPAVKFLGVSLLNSKSRAEPLPSNRTVWGKIIPVPERSQMAYKDGSKLCSPTAVSMLLAYWADRLRRPDLDHDVPEIARAVDDPNWPGTGNWSFNMAYAGSFSGMRAYVTRLTDVSELEDWIAHDIPVGLSVCYNRLRGKSREPSGHVVVLCGFTETGDAVINDPGTRKNVRKTFPRANLIDAWSYSRNTVYLIYPENLQPPGEGSQH